MKKFNSSFFLYLSVVLLFIACVKDTDFDQIEEIEITPVLELDFIYFTLNSESFTENDETNVIVLDTTNFDFLNDSFAVDNLERAEFLLKFTNSFPINFTANFDFIDEDAFSHYSISVPITSGSSTNPTITQHIENIEDANIENLTLAEKVVVSVTASSSLDKVEGTLSLQSKTSYYIKIEQ